jgi:hypothetical protein
MGCAVRADGATTGGPPGAHGQPAVPLPTVQWFFTALLILASAGTVGYAVYLLRRLFTTPPADGGPVEDQ